MPQLFFLSPASRVYCPTSPGVRGNERTDERVAQYSNLYFWLFWPTVQIQLLLLANHRNPVEILDYAPGNICRSILTPRGR